MRAIAARGGLPGALSAFRAASSVVLPLPADRVNVEERWSRPVPLGPLSSASTPHFPPRPTSTFSSPLTRGFAASASDEGLKGGARELSGEELAAAEALFYEMCGKDITPPPDLDELTALAELKRKHDEVYGSESVPTLERINEMHDLVMAEMAAEDAEGDSELDLDGSSSSDSDSDSESCSVSDSSVEGAKGGEGDEEDVEISREVWEEYKLTPEDIAQVKAAQNLPRKVQKSMMQQDLKALLRRQQDPSDVDEEVDPDRERERERIFDMRTVSVQRTCKKNKGGGLFRFQAFVVVGNGDGVIGYGMGKAAEVLGAIDKAYQEAERNLYFVERYRGHTVYEATEGKCTKTKVRVWPRPSGSGIRCNDTLANICALAGIQDIGAKCHGSRHRLNMVKAFFQALDKQRLPEDIAKERGLVAREVAGVLR